MGSLRLLAAAAALFVAAPTGDPEGYFTTLVVASNGASETVKTEINYNDLAGSVARHELRVQQAADRLER